MLMILLEQKDVPIKRVRRFERFLKKVFYEQFADNSEPSKPSLDFSTIRHSERTSWLSALLMDELIDENERQGNKLNEKSIIFWRSVALIGGLLHDIGKVSFPKELLSYKRLPTNSDWRIIIKHPTEAVCMIKQFIPAQLHEDEYIKEVLKVIVMHHERWDGTVFNLNDIKEHGGYPCGLERDEITVPARVVKVTDTYDAAMVRKIGKRNTVRTSLNFVLNLSGKEFDPIVVNLFEHVYFEKIEPTMILMHAALNDDLAEVIL